VVEFSGRLKVELDVMLEVVFNGRLVVVFKLGVVIGKEVEFKIEVVIGKVGVVIGKLVFKLRVVVFNLEVLFRLEVTLDMAANTVEMVDVAVVRVVIGLPEASTVTTEEVTVVRPVDVTRVALGIVVAWGAAHVPMIGDVGIIPMTAKMADG